MADISSTSYQPTVAYQGGAINTQMQEPKSDQTQPIQAPAADTQHGGLEGKSMPSHDRGSKIDVIA